MQALIIGYVWPEPSSSAAGKRMVQLLDFLLIHNYHVTFATPSARTQYMADLESMGITTENIALNDPGFDELIKDLDPSLVIFDRFMMEEQFGWRVSKHCPGAIRILDTEDLHFLRKSRENKISGKQKSDHNELAQREIASIYRCDLSLIISEVEMDLLLTHYKISPDLLLYLPFLYDEISPGKDDLSDFEERKNFICIGNLKHAPNLDAVFYLKETIWPLIHRELPGVHLNIYGAYSPAKVDRLQDTKSGFYIKGRAANAEEVVKKSRLSLVPLRFGAGLKGKLTEAMLCGTPSITTTMGAEGINGNMPWNGVITDDPEAFAAAAVQLYNSEVEWMLARKQGFNIINSRFSKRVFYPIFAARIEKILMGLTRHRDHNFIGKMLMHHRVKSTYYLSKYIETKTELEKLRLGKK